MALGDQEPRLEPIGHLQRLVSLAPRDTELRLRLATELMRCASYDAALSELVRVITLEPNNLPARKLRERVLRRALSPDLRSDL